MKKIDFNNVYHIFGRGRRLEGRRYGMRIFHNEEDRIKFLSYLNRFRKKFNARVFVFALMDNHFHFLVYCLRPRELVKELCYAYNGYYSWKYKYAGPIFDKIANPILKNNNAWALDSMLYIINNPREAGLSKIPSEYKWTSYRCYTKRIPRIFSVIEIDTTLFSDNFSDLKDFKKELDVKLQLMLQQKKHKRDRASQN